MKMGFLRRDPAVAASQVCQRFTAGPVVGRRGMSNNGEKSAMPLNWGNVVLGLGPRSYVCSYCNHRVAPANGWAGHDPERQNQTCFIYVRSFCGCPTHFDAMGRQYPGAPFGNSVADVPQDVGALYAEARNCMKVNSFTSAVLTCRKLLMHIAGNCPRFS